MSYALSFVIPQRMGFAFCQHTKEGVLCFSEDARLLRSSPSLDDDDDDGKKKQQRVGRRRIRR